MVSRWIWCSSTNGLLILNLPWNQRLVMSGLLLPSRNVLIVGLTVSLFSNCRQKRNINIMWTLSQSAYKHVKIFSNRSFSICLYLVSCSYLIWWLFVFLFGFSFWLVDLTQVDDTLDLFNELQLQHQAVATKTKTLHDACDRLVWLCYFSS